MSYLSMGSQQDCMNFQVDLMGLLFDGSNLESEDPSLFDYVSNLENPREILVNSRNLKEEGNSSFKNGDFDDALEKYSMSCVFLSHLVLQEEKTRNSFSQLATSTVLNMAASLLKKNEFRQVGHLCSIILKYNPDNVKALFRRASAAMGLGDFKLALWDLKLASKVEPSNQEVVMKIREVDELLHKPPHEIGQGKEKRMRHLKEMSSRDIGGDKEVVSEIGKSSKREVKYNDRRANAKEINLEMSDSNSKDEEMSEGVEDIKVKVKEDGANQESRKHKYHFQKRKIPESTLAISKKDYHLLAQGRTLQHYNPRTGIVMSIRVKDSSQAPPKKPSESQPQQDPPPQPMDKLSQTPQNENISSSSENSDSQKLSTNTSLSEPVEVKRGQDSSVAPTSQDCPPYVIPIKPSPLCFQKITTGNRSPSRKTRKHAPVKGVKKKRRAIHRKPSRVVPNHDYQCRNNMEEPSNHDLPDYRIGMKRKSVCLQSPELPQKQRKQFISINNDVCNVCSMSVCSCPMQVDSPLGCMNCVRI